MIRNFTYNNIVLYAKGWYESNDLIDDLAYLIDEVYAWCPISEDEVAMYMLNVLDTLYEALENDGRELRSVRWYRSHCLFEEGIRHQMSIYDISRSKATILLVLSILQGLTRDEIELRKPVYGKKCHFRMGGIGEKFPISMTYTEMNKIASKMFDKQ